MITGSDDDYLEYRTRAIDNALNSPHYEDCDTADERLESLLADARHYADQYGLDYGQIDRRAQRMYSEDKWKEHQPA